MPRTDQSITILTGMIIAALYVILLVGFTQESYMRRDAANAAPPAVLATPAPRVSQNVSNRVCRAEPPLCAALFSDASEGAELRHLDRDAAGGYLSEPVVPLTLDGLRRALQEPWAGSSRSAPDSF